MENINNLYWVANYVGGGELVQYEGGDFGKVNEKGQQCPLKENKYQDIDREKLERFDMVDTKTKKVVYSLYLREGQNLIYRRRTIINLKTGLRVVVYLVGWKITVMVSTGPRSFIAINYIHEDGSISLDGSRNNLELLPEEC